MYPYVPKRGQNERDAKMMKAPLVDQPGKAMTFARPAGKTDDRVQDMLQTGISLRAKAASWEHLLHFYPTLPKLHSTTGCRHTACVHRGPRLPLCRRMGEVPAGLGPRSFPQPKSLTPVPQHLRRQRSRHGAGPRTSGRPASR